MESWESTSAATNFGFRIGNKKGFASQQQSQKNFRSRKRMKLYLPEIHACNRKEQWTRINKPICSVEDRSIGNVRTVVQTLGRWNVVTLHTLAHVHIPSHHGILGTPPSPSHASRSPLCLKIRKTSLDSKPIQAIILSNQLYSDSTSSPAFESLPRPPKRWCQQASTRTPAQGWEFAFITGVVRRIDTAIGQSPSLFLWSTDWGVGIRPRHGASLVLTTHRVAHVRQDLRSPPEKSALLRKPWKIGL